MKEKIFKIKEGKLDIWLAWADELNTRKEEVMITLGEENVSRESATLFKLDNDYYVYMSMEFSGKEMLSNLDRELNITHREKLEECLEPIARGKQLYDFRRE